MNLNKYFNEDDALSYAKRLATYIYEKHYKTEDSEFYLLDDLYGVLSQIDNMSTGLIRNPNDD